MKSGNAHVKADFNLLHLLSDPIIVTVCYAQLAMGPPLTIKFI
jgi:hypothetical protein